MPERKSDTIIKRLDCIDEKLKSIDITLAVNTQSLKDHMRRTELLEDEVEKNKKHRHRINGALALFGAVSVAGGIVVALVRLLLGI